MKPSPKSLRSEFRGIKLWEYGTHEVKQLPVTVESLNGKNPDGFVMTRWQPVGVKDKQRTTELRERLAGWCETPNPLVVYGLERWGEWDTKVYREWFSIAVIHPRLTNPATALKICEVAIAPKLSSDEYG